MSCIKRFSKEHGKLSRADRARQRHERIEEQSMESELVSAAHAGFTCQINWSMEEPNDAVVQGIPQPNLVVSAAGAVLVPVR
jgi:hypothetical protein